MKTLALAVMAAAVAAIPAAVIASPPPGGETLTAFFNTPDGGQTVGTYKDLVLITVSGTGQSAGTNVNDAFYDIVSHLHDSQYYQLTFGTTPLVPFNPPQDAINYIVGGLPAYNPTNTYTFLLNTGTATLSTLHFGVSDGRFDDNSGAYTITISQAPEAATWAMMVGGFGLTGAALRRAKRASLRLA